VAARLGKSKRTIHRLVDSGQLLPAMRYPASNGGYLFAEADVDRYEAEQIAATAGGVALRDTA
jgi:hypothetical protein